jgi:separase
MCSLFLIFPFYVAVLQPMSLNVVTPPRQNDVVKPLLVFDDLEKLISLLRMYASHPSNLHQLTDFDSIELTARISGLLSLILSKVHILDVVRRLCERQLGIQSDGR